MRHSHPVQGPAAFDFLAQLPREGRAEFESHARREQYARGEFVFRAGEPSESVYLLRDGRVKIFQMTAPGREAILWFCLPGELFGLAEMMGGGGRPINAQACDACDVLSVRRQEFQALVEAHPKIALLSMQMLASRLRALGDTFANLVADDADTRIAKLILRLAAVHGERHGRDVWLGLPLTHQEIANMAGTSRQTVTQVMNDLKRRGMLGVDGHRIRIEDAEGLWKVALRARAAS